MLPERMEEPDGSRDLYDRTLRQFGLINWLFSGARGLIRREVLRVMKTRPGKSYTFLDVGCGSADLSRWILRAAKRRGLQIKVMAVDYDERAVAVARGLSTGVEALEVRQADARDLQVSADFVFSNHLLHHFNDREVPVVLGSLASAAGLKAIVNDVRRSAPAYLLFGLFAPLFLPGSHHRHDGRLSILKGLRKPELIRALEQAGLAERTRVTAPPIARLRAVISVHRA
jgi:SAM-dependent methyltransferase